MKRFVLLTLILYAIFNPKTIQAPVAPQVLADTVAVDLRAEKLTKFLKERNSPLVGNVRDFIRTADDFDLDWRLLPAISAVESGMGQHTPSCARYNPFGWTSTTSPCGYWRFDSFDEAIRFVGGKIATKTAYSKFQRTGRVEELALAYNPGGWEEWTAKVNYFMELLNQKEK